MHRVVMIKVLSSKLEQVLNCLKSESIIGGSIEFEKFIFYHFGPKLVISNYRYRKRVIDVDDQKVYGEFNIF